MRHLSTLVGIFFPAILFAQLQQTVFEKSGGTSTSTYEQAIDFYKDLAETSEYIQIKEMGSTDSGFPLHLVTMDLNRKFNFKESRKAGKSIILINNGIHPGEPDG
ncbi:MAG: hypothetical protein AAFX57_17710, partial [Bacteroidota bacterium]